MEETSHTPASLVLLIDGDPSTRSLTRPLLQSHGLDVIQARSSSAALELLQRAPERFRLVIVSLEMPDLSGVVTLEILRLFRAGLPTLCLTASERPTVPVATSSCLPKPLLANELGSLIHEAIAGRWNQVPTAAVSPEAVARATAAFNATGSLLEAARELARGIRGEPPTNW
jgi:DNA-binding response OmpR family regulator